MKCYLLFLLTIMGCAKFTQAQRHASKHLKQQIDSAFQSQQGNFAMAFCDVGTGRSMYIGKHQRFHAASTMKTPVLIEAYRQAGAGKFRLDDSIIVYNSFKSIADSSLYQLSSADDSDSSLYQQIGKKKTIHDLLYLMIIRSSNLATNIIIGMLGAANVTATAHRLGAKDIHVLRGVEDNAAFRKGLNNTVSAFGLARLFEKLAAGKAVNAAADEAMTGILLDQQFNDIIPAQLPAGIKVAHKTGFITGLHHDSGIVFLPDGRKYVLVLLSAGLTDEKAAVNMMASVSKMIYDWMMSGK